MSKELNVRITENDNEWVRRWSTQYMFEGKTETFRHSERRQKFFCVSGPLAGERHTTQDATDYVLFNRAYSQWGRITDVPKAVLVWKQVLK